MTSVTEVQLQVDLPTELIAVYGGDAAAYVANLTRMMTSTAYMTSTFQRVSQLWLNCTASANNTNASVFPLILASDDTEAYATIGIIASPSAAPSPGPSHSAGVAATSGAGKATLASWEAAAIAVSLVAAAVIFCLYFLFACRRRKTEEDEAGNSGSDEAVDAAGVFLAMR